MTATEEQESTYGVLQNMSSYLATGSAMYQHEVNGGLKYMSWLGFNYDASNIMAGANNFDGDDDLEDKESLGDKIIAVLSA